MKRLTRTLGGSRAGARRRCGQHGDSASGSAKQWPLSWAEEGPTAHRAALQLWQGRGETAPKRGQG
eukprot:2005407-Alexandrium_andersonii.AAC.1